MLLVGYSGVPLVDEWVPVFVVLVHGSRPECVLPLRWTLSCEGRPPRRVREGASYALGASGRASPARGSESLSLPLV